MAVGKCSVKTPFGTDVPAQLDALARFDSRQIGPGLLWRGSNWAKESQYGMDHKTIEQNEFYDSMSVELHFVTPLP